MPGNNHGERQLPSNPQSHHATTHSPLVTMLDLITSHKQQQRCDRAQEAWRSSEQPRGPTTSHPRRTLLDDLLHRALRKAQHPQVQ